MSSERIKVERRVRDCGRCCDLYAGCKGHTIGYRYNSVFDISTITIDGEDIIVAGDMLVDEIADMIMDAKRGKSLH